MVCHERKISRGLYFSRTPEAQTRPSCSRPVLYVVCELSRRFLNPSPIDIHVLLEAENKMIRGRNRFLELFTVPRNRRAALASFIVMFMQQL